MESLRSAYFDIRRRFKVLGKKLVNSMLRERHALEHTTRSIAIGLFIGFTPTVGIQIPIIFALWGAGRLVGKRLSFNPVLALIWTSFTNVFTIAPIYYVYVQTGRIILGRWDNIRSYDFYLDRFDRAVDLPVGWWENLWIEASSLLSEFGLPLVVGSLPWAVCLSVLGYMGTLRIVRRHRKQRATKLTPHP